MGAAKLPKRRLLRMINPGRGSLRHWKEEVKHERARWELRRLSVF